MKYKRKLKFKYEKISLFTRFYHVLNLFSYLGRFIFVWCNDYKTRLVIIFSS